VVAAGVPNIKTNPAFTVLLATGDAGPVVAAKAANAICNAAVAYGRPTVGCNGFITGGTGVCADAGCCGSASTATMTVSCLGAGGVGFDLTRNATADSLTIAPNGGGSNIQNLMARTKVGNSTGSDFQQNAFAQFLFSGASAQYQLLFATGQPNPTAVSVSFPSECADANSCNTLFATRVNTAFPAASARVVQGSDAAAHNLDAGLVNPAAPFLEVTTGQSFSKMTGTVTPDKEFTIGTADPPPPIPTLSPLGMAAVVILILLSGVWLLRRRRLHA
jgi:hypothetical protein